MEQKEQRSKSDRILSLANRIDWIAAIACLAWAAFAADPYWGVAGVIFLITAWVNPVAVIRTRMARKLVKRQG